MSALLICRRGGASKEAEEEGRGGAAAQQGVDAKLKRKGVKFRNLNNKVLKNLKKAWKEVIQEESKKDPLFAEVYSAYQNFRNQYAIWGEKGYLK